MQTVLQGELLLQNDLCCYCNWLERAKGQKSPNVFFEICVSAQRISEGLLELCRNCISLLTLILYLERIRGYSFQLMAKG